MIIKSFASVESLKVVEGKQHPVYMQVKERCRKGIPPSVRRLAWQQLSGSEKLMQQNQGVFEVR